MYSTLFYTFLVAFLLSLAITPLAIKIAPKIGAVDIPKDNRRMHTHAMPRFGGMAIFVGAMVAMICFLNFNAKIVHILIGGALVYALGVVDDIKGLSAKVKFVVELAIAVYMYKCGIKIAFISNFFGDGHTNFGTLLCFVVTIIWIVGITNTINLIDGLDGLAAGIVAISALCIAYASYIHGTYVSCSAMLAIAGSSLGFLPYNFHPAKIFMGDSGSLFLGFLMATTSILGTVKSATLVAIIIPVVILGVPIFDTFFAIIRRKIAGKSIMEPDKGHLHHRLINLGYGQIRATLMLYGISGVMGTAAVLFSRDLLVEGFGLVAITAMFVYILLTDENHAVPRLFPDEENNEKSDFM